MPVDLLVAGPGAPAVGVGRGRQAKRREATGHAIRWAIDTACIHELVCEPENLRGPVAVALPVAAISALVAMKTIALTDPDRGDKAVTDLLDLWLLLSHDVALADVAIQQLCDAPQPARRWAAQVLVELLRDGPQGLLGHIADGVGAPPSVADVEDVWQALVASHLDALRR